MQKLRADFAKRFDSDSANMTAHRDYEFERRVNDMRRLQCAVDHFDRAVMQGMVAMKEIASAYEAVGQAFTELTLANNNPVPGPEATEEPSPYPTEADVQFMSQQAAATAGAAMADYTGSVTSTRMPDEANSQVRRLAKTFAEEARRINEGQPFQSYNAGIHRDVITRLLPVSDYLKTICEYRHKCTEALGRYNKSKAEVEKVERRYTKKGKPFCDSKTHKRCTQKRDEAWKEYVKRRDKFNNIFGMLMEVNDHAAAQIIHRYLTLNHEYLQQLVASMDRVLPAIAEVYPLNNEYNSLQNTLILEAVANAKDPFTDHSKGHSQEPVLGEGYNNEGPSEGEEVLDDSVDGQQTSNSTTSSTSCNNAAREPHQDVLNNSKTPVMPVTTPRSVKPPHNSGKGNVHEETEKDHHPTTTTTTT
ncbi:hypothetical protein JKF63_07889 [Porcisia hertigi]|uniref:BAR domain-containing protein n=1 Tax=Porcisia hertigi TaxID=2761500 RepID=A0A836LJQ9_9TRYP|nr:hypothetical protein JKF63_07889 [Porcisia hertigi]